MFREEVLSVSIANAVSVWPDLEERECRLVRRHVGVEIAHAAAIARQRSGGRPDAPVYFFACGLAACRAPASPSLKRSGCSLYVRDMRRDSHDHNFIAALAILARDVDQDRSPSVDDEAVPEALRTVWYALPREHRWAAVQYHDSRGSASPVGRWQNLNASLNGIRQGLGVANSAPVVPDSQG